jgi:hypothetical protein
MIYAVYPRHPDLFRFDPVEVGRIEGAMWKSYYEKQYARPFAGLYHLARRQYGFSPKDSLQIAPSAAQAARAFQPSRSRAEADAAPPDLIRYFSLLSRATPVALDPAAAARVELDWWQARREAAGPDDYGLTIARVTTMLYGIDNDLVSRFRSSLTLATPSDANFGIKGTLATL